MLELRDSLLDQKNTVETAELSFANSDVFVEGGESKNLVPLKTVNKTQTSNVVIPKEQTPDEAMRDFSGVGKGIVIETNESQAPLNTH